MRQFFRTYLATITFGIVMITIAGGFGKLIDITNKANEAAAESRRVAKILDQRVDENARTIRQLCDQAYVQVDAFEAGLVYRRAQQKISPSKLRAELITRLEADKQALASALTNPSSPCND